MLTLWLIVSVLIVSAQDARESLGPKDKPAQAKGPHPLTQLMATLNSSLRPELRGNQVPALAGRVGTPSLAS